jgi:hypothetical protein
MALRGVYYRNYVYRHVILGWNDFDPALSLAEQVEVHQLWDCACAIPKEWYQQDSNGPPAPETVAKPFNQRRLTLPWDLTKCPQPEPQRVCSAEQNRPWPPSAPHDGDTRRVFVMLLGSSRVNHDWNLFSGMFYPIRHRPRRRYKALERDRQSPPQP